MTATSTATVRADSLAQGAYFTLNERDRRRVQYVITDPYHDDRVVVHYLDPDGHGYDWSVEREERVRLVTDPAVSLLPEPEPGCYSCLGTGYTVGFGHGGNPCPACHHFPECTVDACDRGCPIRAREYGP